MNKIATHNSATGERGYFLYKIFSLFSDCQSKTIKEQFIAGCRYFDIRILKSRGEWYCGHGLWRTKKTAQSIVNQIVMLARSVNEPTYVSFTLERGSNYSEFMIFVSELQQMYSSLNVTTINYKLPKWRCVKVVNDIPTINKYKMLDGSSWHTFIPIPKLWKKVYYNKPIFNNDVFTFVDFL